MLLLGFSSYQKIYFADKIVIFLLNSEILQEERKVSVIIRGDRDESGVDWWFFLSILCCRQYYDYLNYRFISNESVSSNTSNWIFSINIIFLIEFFILSDIVFEREVKSFANIRIEIDFFIRSENESFYHLDCWEIFFTCVLNIY